MIRPLHAARQDRTHPDHLRLSSRLAPSDPFYQAILEALDLLEQDTQSAERLLQQLAAMLERQRNGLNNCRDTLVALSQARPASPSTPILPQDEPQLRVFCFGQFEVYRHGESISQRRTGKGRAILKFLATRPRQPVPRDLLLELLWPQTQPQIANNRLKVAMHQLRQAFVAPDCAMNCEECVVYNDDCYLFNPNVGVWIDVEAFESYWRMGVQMERAGRMAEAVPFYLEAETLYRGDFLEEDLYEEWTLIQRAELKDTYLTILDKLSRHWLQTGHLDEAVEGWKKIIAKDPWREDIYRQLMACFASQGQRGLALRWYQLCVDTLQQQLGLQPDPETLTLCERIRSGGADRGEARTGLTAS